MTAHTPTQRFAVPNQSGEYGAPDGCTVLLEDDFIRRGFRASAFFRLQETTSVTPDRG